MARYAILHREPNDPDWVDKPLAITVVRSHQSREKFIRQLQEQEQEVQYEGEAVKWNPVLGWRKLPDDLDVETADWKQVFSADTAAF